MFTKEFTKEEILNEMVAIAIGGLIENEACTYCRLQYGDEPACLDGSCCENMMWDGLERKAIQNLKEMKNEKKA